jgi:signal transduction histidine kinase/ligand-binding sensor domain-containing protein
MRQRLLALVLAFTSLAVPARALDPSTPLSQYARTAWTEREGLVSGLIWAITQDQDGYLWLGTDAGLIRFDGVRFVHVDEPLLRTARIGALLSASDGSLWIGSNARAVLSRRQRGRYTYYSVSDGLPLGVTALLEDHEKTLWAGGRGGLSRFLNGHWERLGSGQGLTNEAVTGLFEDADHVLWAATLRGLYQRGDGEQSFKPSDTAFHVRRLLAERSGTLWAVGPEQAIGTPVDARPDVAIRAWSDVNGWSLMRDRDDNIWVATLGRGLLRLTSDPRSGSRTIARIGTDVGLSHDVVRSLFEDREGNIWVGTQHGLNRLSESPIKMITSSSELGQPVRAVTAAPDGSVWAGTDNGVYRFGGATTTHFDRDDGLPALSIGALYTDRHGSIWVAADHGGIARFENGRFVVITSDPRLKRVWAMTRDVEGAFWMCEVDAGLFRLKDGTLTLLSGAPEMGRRFCNAIVTDHAGRVWAGFTDGSVGVRDGERFRIYDQRDGLSGGAVSVIYEDSRGTMWIGSTNGLTSFADGRFTQIGDSNGVDRTNVRAIVEDARHTIWIGDNSGVVRLDDASGGGPTFGMFDGLRGVPMSVGGFPTTARSGDGRLWFVTSSGMAVLDPARMTRVRLPPPVRIEAVLADDKPFATDGTVELPAKTSRIQFDYAGLSFTAPEKVRFRYMLEGFDQDWIDVGLRRQAFYTNLPPRSYRFRVIADYDGVSSETGATLDISIRPTFYQTPAFYAAVAVAGVLLILGAWQVRVRQVHRQFALVLGERARMAREIHDTLLQSLVGVAFQFDAASAELDESPSVAKSRLSRLRTQIELAIKEARQSIWDLRSPALERRDLTTALREAGESITGRSIRFDLAVSGTPRHDAPRLDEALLRIGREAISNAVRHASATEVHVHLSYDRDEVTLRVRDNGRGFESVSPQLANHWGLATMRERAEQLGGRLRLASAPGRGTEVEFIAPFAKGQRA